MIRFVYLLLIYSYTDSQLQFDGLGQYQLLHNIHLSVPIPVDDHFDTNETILTAVAMSTSHGFGSICLELFVHSEHHLHWLPTMHFTTGLLMV